MSIHYHPDESLLAAYSAGSLALSYALCVATHIDMCPQCRSNMRHLNTLGGHFFDQMKPKSGGDELRDKVFSMLDTSTLPADSNNQAVLDDQQDQHKHQNSSQYRGQNDQIPRSLKQFIPNNYKALDWQRISPSIHQAHLCTDNHGAQVALIKIKPGGTLAQHTHTGDEFTLLLKGAFSDESGLYQHGDFIVRNDNHKHSTVATMDSDCICLTVLDAPIQFTGLLRRWLNPILRRKHAQAINFAN